MAPINDFARALNDVYLGNIIDECVVTFEDGKAYITAMDLTSSLLVQTSADIEHDDGQVGIANLTLFVRYLNMIKDIDVTLKQQDNKFIIKPKSGGTVRYLLAEVDLIPSYKEEWPDDMFEEELKEYAKSMTLKQDSVSEFLSIMNLFNPNSVYFEVDKKGKVTLHGGQETENQFDVSLGKIKGVDPCSVKVYGKLLAPILSAVDYGADPQLFLLQGSPVIVTTEKTNLMLNPTEDE